MWNLEALLLLFFFGFNFYLRRKREGEEEGHGREGKGGLSPRSTEICRCLAKVFSLMF